MKRIILMLLLGVLPVAVNAASIVSWGRDWYDLVIVVIPPAFERVRIDNYRQHAQQEHQDDSFHYYFPYRPTSLWFFI